MQPADPTDAPFWVICLCAQWCGVCREWRDTFDAQSSAHPGLRFAWVDVEDEADAMGDVDIETFPTLLVARGKEPLFLGPVQPSGGQLSRLVESLRDGASTIAHPLPARALMQRLAERVLPNH